ncbi:MAG: TetR/AcrR family transcriptional regulator [Planctomycetota bacterium]
MGRPSQINEKRRQLMPVVAAAFAELGYRKATTAELARRCGVRENILYRLWPDKKAMFLASIEYLYQSSVSHWKALLDESPDEFAGRAGGAGGAGSTDSMALQLLAADAKTRGDAGFYRITFAALSETDDPEVRQALKQMYRRFHRFITQQADDHRDGLAAAPDNGMLDSELTAWAIIGVATVADISNALGVLPRAKRQRMLAAVGRALLDGVPDGDT